MKKAVFDSGASLTYVPSTDYYNLYNQIMSYRSTISCRVNSNSGILYCDCSSASDTRYPKISIKMGGRYTFYMSGSDYLIYDS